MNQRPDPADFAQAAAIAIEVEQSLLGCCLMHTTALTAVAQGLSPEHFVDRLHGQIWQTCLDIAAEGRAVNPLTVTAKLGNQPIAGDLKLSEYLARCAAQTSCPAPYAADYARQVREHWALRRIASLGSDIERAALVPGANARELVLETLQQADELRAVLDAKGTRSRSASELLSQVVEAMSAQMRGEVVDSFVSTGLRDLDRMLCGGFKAGDLVVVAGRPGMGKTTLAASIARQAAKAGHAGVFFSLEMPEQQIGARMASDEAFSGPDSVTANQILRGQVNEMQAVRVIESVHAMRALPLIIEAPPMMTVGDISARTRAIADRFQRAGRKLDFIVLDYLKFIRATERYQGQRHYEIGEITAGLKALAKDMGIAVVLCAQLNREVEKLADKRPTLSHLRESGDIEADADVVLLLYREAYYLDQEADPSPDKVDRLIECRFDLDIIVAKQRMGPTGVVQVFCHPGASAVRNKAKVI